MAASADSNSEPDFYSVDAPVVFVPGLSCLGTSGEAYALAQNRSGSVHRRLVLLDNCPDPAANRCGATPEHLLANLCLYPPERRRNYGFGHPSRICLHAIAAEV